jgi:hypothetical protein
MEKAPGIDCRCTHRACNGKAHSAAIESNQKSISRRNGNSVHKLFEHFPPPPNKGDTHDTP